MRIDLRRVIPIACLAMVLAACGGSSTGPAEDKIVEGVNFSELFAPPTAAEIGAVRAMWETRDASARDIVEVSSAAESFDGADATVRVVSHTVDGARHYGAIASADDAPPGSLPILVYLHGGDAGENVSTVQTILSYAFSGRYSGGVPDDFVYVVPSFRSETLRYKGVTYQSEGEPSPWDRDVDDALALLNVAIETVPAADPSRIGVVGFSRGGCVAMLMAARDPRIDLVVEFFGPTDFFGTFVQTVTEEALLGEPRDLPGLDYLNEDFIQPLRDSVLTIADVRSQMVRRSPVYFADRLPQLQIHHGTADSTVWVSEAERLIQVMLDAGHTPPEFEYYFYEGAGHDPFDMDGSIDRGVEFIARLLIPALRSPGHTIGREPI